MPEGDTFIFKKERSPAKRWLLSGITALLPTLLTIFIVVKAVQLVHDLLGVHVHAWLTGWWAKGQRLRPTTTSSTQRRVAAMTSRSLGGMFQHLHVVAQAQLAGAVVQ